MLTTSIVDRVLRRRH